MDPITVMGSLTLLFAAAAIVDDKGMWRRVYHRIRGKR